MTNNLGRLLALDGRIALVTGGARGIGRAVCELFAEAGASVALCGLDLSAAEATAAMLDRARAYQTDISDQAAVERLFGDVVADLGGIDILIHAAAIFPKRAFTTMTAEQWDELHAVNVRGTFLVMREAVKAMRDRGGGAIVNISSVSGERAAVFHNSAYGASKAAVTNLTRSVALEAAAHNIRVNAVLPGGVATEGSREAAIAMQAQNLTVEGPLAGPGRIPLGRVAEPSEIAAACLFLASPAASYITGHSLVVDGGFLIG